MSEECFVRYANGRYWVSPTGLEFENRHEVKGWLIQRGVDPTVAENTLNEADTGVIAARVLLPDDSG